MKRLPPRSTRTAPLFPYTTRFRSVGRRIAALEASIGAPLFVRHSGGYRLTADGQSMLGDAERVEEAMARLRANATARTVEAAGTVRLAAPDTLTTHILLPSLRPLLDRYPALKLDRKSTRLNSSH